MIEPHGWVVRAVDDKDYGLDDEVEVFENGEATGIKFFVQSKGTDSTPGSTGAMTMILRDTHENYFAELDVPVLLVRYVSKSSDTFVEWFHRVDSFPRPRSHSVRFSPASKLTLDTVPDLAEEMRAWRGWHARTPNWPVRIKVTSKTDHDARDLELEVDNIAGGSSIIDPGGFGHVPRGQPWLAAVVSDDSIRVDGSLASHTIHGDAAYVKTRELRAVARDILYSAAVVLGNLGFGSRAAPLLATVLCTGPVNADVAEMAGRYFHRSDRMDCAIRTAAYGLEHASVPRLATSMLVLSSACSEIDRGEFGVLRQAAELLGKIVDEAQSAADLGADALAAAASHQLARAYFSLGEWSDADDAYSRAVALDDSIPSKGAVLAELAGAAHHVGDYGRAVSLYTSAIARSPEDTLLLARRADSALHQGQINQAKEQFEEYLEVSPVWHPAWRLKHGIASFLLSSGMENRIRDAEKAERVLRDRPAIESFSGSVKRCLAAAKYDVLHGGAWGEIGQLEVDAGRPYKAAAPLLIAAFADRRSTSWVLALAAAIAANLEEMSEAIATLALFDFGEEFHRELRAHFAGSADRLSVVTFVEDIDEKTGRQGRR